MLDPVHQLESVPTAQDSANALAFPGCFSAQKPFPKLFHQCWMLPGRGEVPTKTRASCGPQTKRVLQAHLGACKDAAPPSPQQLWGRQGSRLAKGPREQQGALNVGGGEAW